MKKSRPYRVNGDIFLCFWRRRWAACVAATLLGLTLPAAAAPYLPPLVSPSTDERLPGKFVWIDLVTNDLAAAQTFYGNLFGWVYAELGDGARPYALAYVDGQPVAGMAQRRAGRGARGGPSRWVAYLSVPDVDQAARRTTSKGGTVLISPITLPERGEMALLADPDGAPFGVIRSSSGDPADGLPPVGDFIWAVYQSPAASRAAAFYQDIASYEVVPDDRVPNVPDFLLAAHGFARASLVEIPADKAALRPAWLYFVRVADVDRAVARARQFGGGVLVAPRRDLVEGRLAVITDPTGGALGLLEWPPANPEGE